MADFRHTLLVTDLDATFFSHPSRIAPRNLEAIERFKAAGGRFTASTGRIPPNIRKALPQYATLFNAPAITANGSYIYDLRRETAIHGVPMDPHLVCEVAAFVEALNPQVGMRVSEGEGILVNASRMVSAILRDLEGQPDHYATILPLSEWDPEGAVWYKIAFRGEYEELCAIRPAVEERFGAYFESNASSPRFFELQAKGCNKASGLRFLADYLAQEEGHPIRTVAIGDEENDLAMLRAADVSACPANAIPAVKQVVHREVCHCDEGSIADLIEWLERESL